MTTRSHPHKPNSHILVEFRAHSSKSNGVVTILPHEFTNLSLFGVCNGASLMSIACIMGSHKMKDADNALLH